MTAKTKTVIVKVISVKTDKIVNRRAPAVFSKSGLLAVTPYIESDKSLSERRWTVTHIASGYGIGVEMHLSPLNKGQARKLMGLLDGLEWGFTDAYDAASKVAIEKARRLYRQIQRGEVVL